MNPQSITHLIIKILNKMKKLFIISILIFILIYLGLISICGYPLVIDLTEGIEIKTTAKLNSGDQIKPLDNLNFDEDRWSSYIIVDNNDRTDLNSQLPNTTILYTADLALLKELKSKWSFTYTGGDMTTVKSYIIFFKNGHKMFESGIVLDKSRLGLQSSQYGWLENPDIIFQLKKFHKLNWPIIILF